ncbi:MAG: septal ring lytic transglycosylase RlpA family protein [Chitinophagaceae bacterium]
MKLILTIAILMGVLFGAQALNAQGKEKVTKNGTASYYHPKFDGRKTATGDVFQNSRFTAASNELRLNTFIKVTNLKNGRVVYVRVNDRMAPSNKRLLDMTEAAAEALDYRDQGLANVKLEVVTEEEGKNAILAQRVEQARGSNTL